MKVKGKKKVFVLEDRNGATFVPGQKILQSGIYRVLHGSHRQAHEVTLLAGQEFPRCNVCGAAVSFSLQQAAPALDSREDFRIRLYEIPHPEEKEDGLFSARLA